MMDNSNNAQRKENSKLTCVQPSSKDILFKTAAFLSYASHNVEALQDLLAETKLIKSTWSRWRRLSWLNIQ